MDNAAAYRFGVLVRQRRKELGLTQSRISRIGGPAGPIMSNIERAVATSISADTLRKLDVSLGWTEGSAARTLAGGVPTLLCAPPVETYDRVPDGALAVPVEVISSLLGAVRGIHGLLGGDIDVKVLDSVRKQLDALESAMGPVLSRYVTALLETHVGNNRVDTIPIQLGVIEHLLDSPSAEDFSAYDDTRYRRWLTGRCTDIDLATEARYQSRLRGSPYVAALSE